MRGARWKRSGRRWRRRVAGRSLNRNENRRPRLEEADHRIGRLRRPVGVETKIVQSAPANSVRVLILRERLRTPGQSTGSLGRTPGRIGKARVPQCSILGTSRMIGRSVKPEVAHYDSTSQRHSEELDRAIQVHIIDGIFVVPDARVGPRHFIGNEGAAIDSRLRFDRIDGRSSPGIDGRVHSHGGCRGGKSEARAASNIKLTVGGIVVHVALPGMGLAPGVFVWAQVLHFGVISCAWVQGRVQVATLDQKPVRCPCVRVAGVVQGGRCEGARKGVYPGARTQAVLVRVLTRYVYISASRAQMGLVLGGTRATKAAHIIYVCCEHMLYPGLAYLLKAIGIGRSAAHSIEILRYDWMIRIWQRKNLHWHVAGVANGRLHAQANLGPFTSKLSEAFFCRICRSHFSRNDIGSGIKTFRGSLRLSRNWISRAVAQEQKQREHEATKDSPEHYLNLSTPWVKSSRIGRSRCYGAPRS